MKVRQVKESGRYGSSNPDTMSPGNYDRYQQDQMDYGKREFKRREMEHELGHEDEQERKEQSGTWYIRINGKLLKNKEGQPYQFRGKAAANKAAVTMMSKPFNRDKKFTLTTTASDKQDNPTPESSIAEMDGAPGQILAATGDKVTIDNKDGTQTIAPKASLTRDPTGKGFVLSKTPTAGGEKPDEPKPGETVFKPATTEGIEKMNEAIRMLRLAGLHKAADRLMEQQLFENPWEGKDPAKAQAWASMSPADQKWLGGADPTDQYILARAPNKGKPAAPAAAAPAAPAGTPPPPAAAPAAQKVDPDQADRDDAEQGAAMRANAAGGNSTSAATGAGNPGEEAAAELARVKQLAGTPTAQQVDPNQADRDDAEMGAAMTANAQAANGVNAAGQNVTMPDGTNPETGAPTTTTAGAPAAPTQAASPAAPAKTPAKSDPNIKALQDKLIAAGAKIKADGVMGPATQAAMKQFPKAVSGNVPLPQGVAPSTAGGGRGGQGGPTAAQAAQMNITPAPRPGVNQPATQPGAGQKGPTKAAAAGQDPTNPLNKAPAAQPGGARAGGPISPAGKAVAADIAKAGAAAPAPAPAPAPSTQSAQSKAISADYLSANDAGPDGMGRNPNAGLEPGDPRWRGPKPASETIYREELNKMLTIARLR